MKRFVMKNGRSHKFGTVQVRIGTDCHKRLLSYCRSRSLFLSQVLTTIVEDELKRLRAKC